MKYHRLCGFNNRTHFWRLESKIKVSVSWFLPKFLLGLQMAAFSLYAHTAGAFSSSYKDTSSIELGLHPMTSFNLSYPFKSPFSKYWHTGC